MIASGFCCPQAMVVFVEGLEDHLPDVRSGACAALSALEVRSLCVCVWRGGGGGSQGGSQSVSDLYTSHQGGGTVAPHLLHICILHRIRDGSWGGGQFHLTSNVTVCQFSSRRHCCLWFEKYADSDAP